MSLSQASSHTDPTWDWPFSLGDLTAGLRRSFSDLTLRVSHVEPVSISRRRPSIGVVRGVEVSYHGHKGEGSRGIE